MTANKDMEMCCNNYSLERVGTLRENQLQGRQEQRHQDIDSRQVFAQETGGVEDNGGYHLAGAELEKKKDSDNHLQHVGTHKWTKINEDLQCNTGNPPW